MNDLRIRLGRYLNAALGIAVTAAPWENERRVPLFLQDRYRFFKAQVLDLPCLFMADRNEREEPPATIRKHIDQVRDKWNEPVVYVRERITSYNRKRLIEHKVPFIVPGTQMYLPMLGIDLREHFRRLRPEKSGLGPASQAVLIHALLQSAEDLSPTVLAAKLGYSVMTMSRALDELVAAELGVATVAGRERRLHLIESRRKTWEKAQPLLRDPVLKRHVMKPVPDRVFPGLRSGLGALAHRSMLAEPENVTLAIDRKDSKALRNKDAVVPAMVDEPGATTLEVWSYAPALFAGDGWVDPLSLYLSLRHTQDDRVQTALDQMIQEVSW